jgi:hypothetical protein
MIVRAVGDEPTAGQAKQAPRTLRVRSIAIHTVIAAAECELPERLSLEDGLRPRLRVENLED